MKKPNVKTLVQMLQYMRPEGGKTQQAFCAKYLKPVFGLPDISGNFVLAIGDKPQTMFTAHHDTVHRKDGMQMVQVKDGFAQLPRNSESNCLGADCTTGIWLILHMIANQVPGLYVIFAGEEIGCVGSRDMATQWPAILDSVKSCISFDRRDIDSIVTHQSGLRTCSTEFAESLADLLDLGMMPDDSGSYTDSNEFAALIPECTNISVGYYGQHGKTETQDLEFAVALANRLTQVSWGGLTIARDPATYGQEYESTRNRFYPNDSEYDDAEKMAAMVEMNPEAIACLLMQLGYSVADIAEELGFGDAKSSMRYSDIFDV